MKVYVVGVGMTRFEKPGRKKNWDYTDYVLEAATKALIDANLTYDTIQFAAAGYCFGNLNHSHHRRFNVWSACIVSAGTNSNTSG
jgi:sterol carrier protein 2